MTRLFLMRHGNTFEAGEIPVQIGCQTDLPLTAQGKMQAKKMGAYLLEEGIGLESLYAGRLKRQVETAQIIGTLLDLEVQSVGVLSEIDYGVWEGLSSTQILAKWPKEYIEWTEEAKWQPQIFQSCYEMHLQQLEEWLSTLRKSDKTVLAVTSNGLLRLLHPEKVKTGHFCELELEQKGFRICSWNRDPMRTAYGPIY